MKLIIDIPEDTHEWITRPDRLFTDNDINKVCWAVYNGTPIPDNATNGQVIQTLFKPNRVERTDDDIIVENYDFNEEWWNSPYQKGGKE